MENIALYFREGPSDKVYQASLLPQEGGYVVHFAYGRRGSTLNTGSKTQAPVDYPIAKGIYDKLIKGKMAKGYTPGENGTPYQHTDNAKQASGIQCQLLNPIDEPEAERLLSDRDYWMQEKLDGRRLLIKKEGTTITGINRLGLTIAVPETIAASASKYRGDFLIDGEAVGDILHAFDLLAIGPEDMRPKRYAVRCLRLQDLLQAFPHPHIEIVATHCHPLNREKFSQFKREGKEGVVFKHVDAPYTPGRPNTGGNQLKHKFYETGSFIVAKTNDKRSVSLILFEGEKVRAAGNVTIPPNHPIPAIGAIIEVRYLYAFRESGCIYQPVYLGPRDDLDRADCTTDRLKFKPATAAA